MKEYKLKELFDLQMGKTPSRNNVDYWDDPVYKWISIGDLSKSGKYISETKEYLSEKAIVESGISIIPENTVIMSFKLSIGKTAITSEPMYSNEAIMSFRDKYITELMPDYIYYLLLSKDWDVGTNKAVMGKTLNKATLSEIVVGIHDIAEQKIIVSTLDKLGTIIEERKIELQKLDELIKARFVELFGDIKTNEHGWKKCSFKDVSTKITDGEHGTVPRVDEGEGYLYFMARNITKDGEIDLSETSYVPQEIHEKIYKRCNPEKDDLLLVCVGATIGKCTLVPETMGEFSMARSVALIKPNKEMVTSNFLINVLRSESIQNDIDHCSHAAAQAGLYTNMINSLEAFVPPMNLQIEFDSFCEQVDKSKSVAQKSLDKAQLLFASLMQEYFG